MARKKKEQKYRHIGVKFQSNMAKIYEYRVRDSAKVYLGQELVVRNQYGVSVVFVCDLNYKGDYDGVLKEVTDKVTKL